MGTQEHELWERQRVNEEYERAVEALNAAGWPVGEIVDIHSAGQSLSGHDEILWRTPSGLPMVAYVEPPQYVQNPPQVVDVEEGW